MPGYIHEVPVIDRARSRCGFMDDTPGQYRCDERATVHLWLESDEIPDGGSALACDKHAPRARQAARLVAEHEYGALCGLPGTWWDFENHCCAIDDSGVELPAKMAEALEVPA